MATRHASRGLAVDDGVSAGFDGGFSADLSEGVSMIREKGFKDTSLVSRIRR